MQVLTRTQTTSDCPDTIVCRCLQVSEGTVADAVALYGLSTVREVCCMTGAGGGCNACHAKLRELIQKSNEPSPIC